MEDQKLPCILISGFEGPYSVNEDHVRDLKKHFNLITMQDFLENKTHFSKKIQAIYLWGVTPHINQELLQNLPALKIIVSPGAGLDHLDLKMIASFGVKVANTPHAVSNSTADMGMALLLASARKLLEGNEVATSPNTKYFSLNWMGEEVTGSTLGIIGMGRIGYKVAQRAKGFEMKILYHNRNRRSHPLLKLKNVILTPHIGVGTHQCLHLIKKNMVESLLAALSGLPIPNEVQLK
ncbi:putative 2-hydroxyacid dehydrogenase SERP1888 [Petaurus breviceps papuanus]|uniref:putative 2-hydroxyacid dehydrogenase SERP1888 n=1 Tax=Petaurus breviceps papuanus TaxID=3040969 RepID=UPI0036D7E335